MFPKGVNQPVSTEHLLPARPGSSRSLAEQMPKARGEEGTHLYEVLQGQKRGQPRRGPSWADLTRSGRPGGGCKGKGQEQWVGRKPEKVPWKRVALELCLERRRVA